ncbi:MAG: hypothetical protein ACYS9X_17880 [Planctomycetota bacterium]|jgi:hypothetical protein
MKNHGGLAEILKTGKAPGVKVAWGGGMVSGLAKYPGDPDSYCRNEDEVKRKCVEQGKMILEDHT